jgi:hypothetical protein
MVVDIWTIIGQKWKRFRRGQLSLPDSIGRIADIVQISSHALIPLEAGNTAKAFPTVPHSSPLQYRLESNTVKLFAKGTGRGYL